MRNDQDPDDQDPLEPRAEQRRDQILTSPWLDATQKALWAEIEAALSRWLQFPLTDMTVTALQMATRSNPQLAAGVLVAMAHQILHQNDQSLDALVDLANQINMICPDH